MATLWTIYSFECLECSERIIVSGSPRRGDPIKCPNCGLGDEVEEICGDCRDEESEEPLECILPHDFY